MTLFNILPTLYISRSHDHDFYYFEPLPDGNGAPHLTIHLALTNLTPWEINGKTEHWRGYYRSLIILRIGLRGARHNRIDWSGKPSHRGAIERRFCLFPRTKGGK